MFKAPHDNPYLLFAHSTSTCPTNPTPSTLPICQRHPNTLSTSSSSARAGHHFLCAVTVLSRRVGGFRFLLVSPPSTVPGLRHPLLLCALWFPPSRQAVCISQAQAEVPRLHHHTHHTPACERPQSSPLPAFSGISHCTSSPRQPAAGLESKQK